MTLKDITDNVLKLTGKTFSGFFSGKPFPSTLQVLQRPPPPLPPPVAVGFMAAFRSTGARQYAKTLHGIDPGLIIVRVAQFRRPLRTFHQKLSSTPRHRVGKAKA
jgi:hypothetical protein